ncbi:mitochondrial genome maintenance protein MGM101 [Peziza echinospora]|nr:mitochondrial genome maintenance protein MGM101 [Peziza echinospora]
MASTLATRCARRLLVRKPKAFTRLNSTTASPAAAPATAAATAPATPAAARPSYRPAPTPATTTTGTTYAAPSSSTSSGGYGGSSYSSSYSAGGASNTVSVGAPRAAEAFKNGLNDAPALDVGTEAGIDWARSFSGLSDEPFPEKISDILLAPLDPTSIEVKPDGILYLPEIKYRRILNKAFGPGGWGLAPRSDTIVTDHSVTREYGLICHGRLVSVARGEQDYFDPSGIPTATEGCKSNALMRTCKDLGIASELWDPRFIKNFRKENCVEVMAEHQLNKKRKKLWFRKGDVVEFPYRAV